jgi:hypothetical protein
MSTLAFILAQVPEVVEASPVFFKRLGEQGFLVLLLVMSNYVTARVLLGNQRERIADLKEEIEDLKKQRDSHDTHNFADALRSTEPPSKPDL